MEPIKDTRARIFDAADLLYEQAGRAAFPTVDAVRKAARVNMNDASTGMKAWRHAQTVQAAPVAVQVPEAIMQAGGVALATLWRVAQELAGESLRVAQAGWDVERIETEALSRQVADAFEAQKIELEAARAQIEELEAAGRKAKVLAEAQRQFAAEAHRMVERMATVQTECDRAGMSERQAREEAAVLRGQLDAFKEQNSQLIQAVKSQGEKPE